DGFARLHFRNDQCAAGLVCYKQVPAIGAEAGDARLGSERNMVDERTAREVADSDSALGREAQGGQLAAGIQLEVGGCPGLAYTLDGPQGVERYTHQGARLAAEHPERLAVGCQAHG